MNTHKFSVAMAAVLLGLQFGSPTVAAVSEAQLQTVEDLVVNGQVEELMAFLAQYPDLLDLTGALGDALRAFVAEPSLASLQAVAGLTEGGITVAMTTAKDPQVGTSIY